MRPRFDCDPAQMAEHPWSLSKMGQWLAQVCEKPTTYECLKQFFSTVHHNLDPQVRACSRCLMFLELGDPSPEAHSMSCWIHCGPVLDGSTGVHGVHPKSLYLAYWPSHFKSPGAAVFRPSLSRIFRSFAAPVGPHRQSQILWRKLAINAGLPWIGDVEAWNGASDSKLWSSSVVWQAATRDLSSRKDCKQSAL